MPSTTAHSPATRSKDIHDAKVSKGVSGVAGVGITFVVAATVFGGVRIVVRRRNRAGTAGRPSRSPRRSPGVAPGHHRPLFVDRPSPVHALPPQCKLVATFAFVCAVVVTPRTAFWAFVAYAAVLAGVAVVARIPPGVLFRRFAIELPFVAFAVLMPFVGAGARTDVLGMSLSVEGLWGAWNILVKGTLGVAATGILVSTTEVRDLLVGLDRLHVPRAITGIAGFMVRYGEVIAGELRAMHVARISRGHDPGWIWQVRAVAASAGTLFIRSYERGERVYLAMASRGYGAPLAHEHAPAGSRTWARALSIPVVAALVALLAVVS